MKEREKKTRRKAENEDLMRQVQQTIISYPGILWHEERQFMGDGVFFKPGTFKRTKHFFFLFSDILLLCDEEYHFQMEIEVVDIKRVHTDPEIGELGLILTFGKEDGKLIMFASDKIELATWNRLFNAVKIIE